MSSLPPDPYKILGVSKDAQLPEIRSAHRKLVLKCHPDKVQDPKLKEEKQKEFQQVQQAYELLSNEAERTKYDEKVKLEELRKERGMTSTSTSTPRSSKRTETKYHFDVREAEPRPTTFAASPSSHNVYGHTPPSRSWDEDIYRKYDDKPRYARKTASYEYEREKPSRKEEERRRRKEEEEWNKEKDKARERELREAERIKEREALRERGREREREKEKEAAKKEKERRKDDRKEDKKRSDKDRRKESEEKHRRHKSPYIEVCPDDQEENLYTTSPSKSDKKKSSSTRKYDDVPVAPPPPRETSRPPPTTERERKNTETLESAIRYLSRSGGKPPTLNRAQTYHPEFSVRHIAPIAVPTPPPATTSVFTPPPMADSRDMSADEDPLNRSSGRTRRMSHDTPRSKEKSSKKSGPPREIIVDATPISATARGIPSFQKSHSIPIPIHADGHRIPPLSRSNTDNYSRPPQAPGLERASTWMAGSELGRDRSRSRPTRIYCDESSEEDRDRRHRRGRRMQSPEPITTQSTKRYTVDSTRRVIPVPEHYFAEDTPRSSKKTSHHTPNSSARREARPSYYVHESYEEDTHGPFPNVKYADQFDPKDIKYTEVPHSTFQQEVYT
ncbi:DnaJ-domain-containing protein [Daldinia caldariorum]|uniref:DnaJ-domain-containing protein n=1 Tax=Daldinia caldariorum TaxID=326644 RepID=UPI00200872CB|nr:DnaJ-domain-containing protein [Daldinia caldariorum]KAI1463418.1 DnaJ-domain-containing protein [Daldinia caldariorum]